MELDTLFLLMEKYPDRPFVLDGSKYFINIVEAYLTDDYSFFTSKKIIDIIKNYKYKSLWTWKFISEDEDLSIQFITKYIDREWNWRSISFYNKNICELVEKYPYKPWNWKNISHNNFVTVKFIEKNIDKEWNWRYISLYNKYIEKLIEKYPDKPWDFEVVSRNDYITIKLIESNINEKWNWKILGRNKFTLQNKLNYEKFLSDKTILNENLISKIVDMAI